jgi:hypothetical protein
MRIDILLIHLSCKLIPRKSGTDEVSARNRTRWQITFVDPPDTERAKGVRLPKLDFDDTGNTNW